MFWPAEPVGRRVFWPAETVGRRAGGSPVLSAVAVPSAVPGASGSRSAASSRGRGGEGPVTPFHSLTLVHEGLLLYFLLRSGAVDVTDPVPSAVFRTHFTVVRSVGPVANGPTRVPFVR
ncbi:hypothetical protein [Streptosporangium sp. NPDC051022]|uniref:hypothetical protein n=1 Tax=Streptosporangium sp. NPDC051022 TaxID=3155752 RepID=UPI003428B6E4